MASKRQFESVKSEVLKCFENSQHSMNIDKCGKDFIKIFDRFVSSFIVIF